jgi:hypothetical protein
VEQLVVRVAAVILVGGIVVPDVRGRRGGGRREAETDKHGERPAPDDQRAMHVLSVLFGEHFGRR